MKVCELTDGIELHADIFGIPFLTLPPKGLRPAGATIELIPASRPEWVRLIEAWQSRPDNDCLRARGDVRWQAASVAAGQCK